MATPVGPVERDPNDPDLWDWGDPGDGEDDDPSTLQRHPALAILAAGLVLVMVLAVVASLL